MGLREFVGLVDNELAARIEVETGDTMSDTYLGRIERHQRPYNQAILEQAAVALRCDVADLFGPPPSPDRPEDDLTRHLKKLKTREERARAARILAAAFEEKTG